MLETPLHLQPIRHFRLCGVAFDVSLVVLTLLCPAARSEPNTPAAEQPVTFVQLTDPHIFDDGYKEATAGAFRIVADNREALTWAIAETNQIVASGVPIDFVVITGDLGLQNVEIPPPCVAEAVPFLPGVPPVRFDSAVQELANELGHLTVKKVYFLPGNNDLIDEKIEDMSRYTCFINELQKKLLSIPNSPVVAALDLDSTFLLRGVNFTGLNSAIFKKIVNYQKACPNLALLPAKTAVASNKNCPAEQLSTLRRLIAPAAKAPLIIFTHVPDLNDPYTKRLTWGDFDPNLRRDWEDEACRSNVLGIFAGHFHDPGRQYYGSPAGAQLLASSACVTSRTWVTPPLAVKNQRDKWPQARGLLLATVGPHQPVHAELHWFNAVNSTSPRTCHFGGRLFLILLAMLLILAAAGWLLWPSRNGKGSNAAHGASRGLASESPESSEGAKEKPLELLPPDAGHRRTRKGTTSSADNNTTNRL